MRYYVYLPGQPPVEHTTEATSYEELRPLIVEHLNGADPEHVYVLHNGERRDLFVDEVGHLKHLPRNEAATSIYRNAYLSRHPGTHPEALDWIAGPAVLFPDDVVWK